MRVGFLIVLLLTSLAGCAADDTATVRDRWLTLHTRVSTHTLAALDARAADLLARQGADSGWGDVTDAHSPAFGFTADAFTYPRTLAQAFATPGSRYYRDPALPARVATALRYLRPLLPAAFDNWWARDIGLPTAVAETLLYLGDAAPDRAAWVRTLRDIGAHPQQFGFNKPGTGANALSIARVALLLALVDRDPALLARARDIAAAAVRVNPGPGEGLMPDGSFHQHGNGLEFSYGASFLQDAAELLWLTRGTAGAWPSAARGAVGRAFADYAAWESFRGKVNPFSLGRGGTRPGAFQAQSVTRAALFLLDAGVPEARAAALAHLADFQRGGDLAAVLPAVPVPAPASAPLAGVRAYPHSDYLVARTTDFFFGVRLASARTVAWFSGSGENLLGHGAGEGAYTLLTDGLELAQDTVVNRPWNSLPGVTAAPGLSRKADTPGESRTAVAALGDTGVLAADYRLSGNEQTLSGRKSYLVLGGAVVLLGSEIHGAEASTTLLSLPVRADAPTFRLGGEHPAAPGTWPLNAPLRYRGVGLRSLGGDPAEVVVERLTRDYREVNTLRNLPTRYETTYLSVRVPNVTGRYAALLLPTDTAVPVEVVAHTAAVHAARRADGSAAAVACFASGTSPAGGLDRPGVLLWTRTGRAVTLAVQSPEPGPIRVTLPFRLRAPGAVRTPGGTIISVSLPSLDVVRISGSITR
jgi:hypothetical protein